MEHKTESDITPSAGDSLADEQQISAWQAYRHPNWYKNTFLMSLVFAKHCIVPALLWIGGMGTVILSSAFSASRMMVTHPGIVEIMQAFFISLAALIISLPLLIWFFAAWLVRLTAYCETYLQFSTKDLLTYPLDKEKVKAAQTEALHNTRMKKAYIAKFWSTLTLYLLPLFFVFIISMVTLVATSPTVLGDSAIVLPPWSSTITWLCCAASGLYLTAVSFAGICVSSVSTEKERAAAMKTFKISRDLFVPLLVVTLASGLIDTLVTSPREILQIGHPPELLTGSTWIQFSEELWRTLSSTVMWTVTLAPICQLVKGKIE